MNPLLFYILILFIAAASWCTAAHAWVAAAVLLVLAALLFGRWAELKFARWIRHVQLHRELEHILNERTQK
jgi:hypothetical protein